MNRAEKRRQQKLAEKMARKAATSQSSNPLSRPQGRTIAHDQAVDMARTHHAAGRLREAESIYQHVLEENPEHPAAMYLLGVVAHQSGRLDEAITRYRKALAIDPDIAEAHNNLGSAFMKQGKLEDAIACYNRAVTISPDFFDAHFNLGDALNEQGLLEDAVESYRRALQLDPTHEEAHCNLGNALSELGQLKEAEASYRRALALNPAFAEAHCNLYGPLLDANDLGPAVHCLEQAVAIHPDLTDYRFILGVLLDYSGAPETAAAHFEMVERGSPSDRAKLDGWRYLKSATTKLPPIIGSNIETFRLAINAAVNEGLVLEFGVNFGTSIRQIAKLVEQDVHGFDSFEGLPESWHHEAKGAYSTGGVIPSVPANVTLYKGWFDESLPEFISAHPEPVRFINIDCDIYSSTKTVLDLLAKQIIIGTVIVFDEYIGTETWRDDEFKAFQEAARTYGWTYEYLCFSFMTRQVAVRIT